MLVKELIEKLQALDPESPVLVYDAVMKGCLRELDQVRQTKVAPKSTTGFFPCFDHLPKRNTVEAVLFE